MEWKRKCDEIKRRDNYGQFVEPWEYENSDLETLCHGCHLVAIAPKGAVDEVGAHIVQVHLVRQSCHAQIIVLQSHGKVGTEEVTSFHQQVISGAVAVLVEEVIAVSLYVGQ